MISNPMREASDKDDTRGALEFAGAASCLKQTLSGDSDRVEP